MDFTRNVARLFEAEGTEAGGEQVQPDGQTVDQPTEPEVPEFDPSTVDISDPDQVGALDEEQLAALEEYNKEHPEGAPAEETHEENRNGDDRLAGKYDTEDDLVKGVNEIVGKLKYSTDIFQPIIEAAKKSGDFTMVEELYKKLESQLGASEQAAAAAAAAATNPSPADKAADDTFNAADPQVVNAVDQLTLSQLASSNIATRMAAKNISLPRNMEEFDALAEVNPWLAMEFKSAYQELYKSNMEEAKAFFTAKGQVEGSNAGVIAADTQALKALATEQGFKLTDEEIAAAKTAALANPNSYEMRHGQKFLKPNAIRDQFLVSALSGKMKEVRLAAELAGREQMAKDMHKASKREVRSLGTARVGARQRAVQKMPDLNDPDVISQLPDEALADPEGWFLKQGFVK